MQDNDLSEFDESRDIIESLVDEYKACESPDYIKWGMEVNLPGTYFCHLQFFLPNINESLYVNAGSRPHSDWRRQCYRDSGSKIGCVSCELNKYVTTLVPEPTSTYLL